MRRWVVRFTLADIGSGAGGAARLNPATGARPGNEIGTGRRGRSRTTPAVSGRRTQSRRSRLTFRRLMWLRMLRHAVTGSGAYGAAGGSHGRGTAGTGDGGDARTGSSVPLFQTDKPSKNSLVEKIDQALQALGTGDRARTVQLIEAAMKEG